MRGATHASHGFKVAIATVAVAQLYEALFKLPLESLDVEAAAAAWPQMKQSEQNIRALIKEPEIAEKGILETQAKYITPDQLRDQLNLLRKAWPQTKARLRKHLLPADEIRQMLTNAGAPCEPEQIDLSRDQLRHSFLPAYHIRRRFTVLDLAVRANVLDRCLDEIYGRVNESQR
jgi:glycerol-1-phosphate dehydrogenase [NAD(P)+]